MPDSNEDHHVSDSDRFQHQLQLDFGHEDSSHDLDDQSLRPTTPIAIPTRDCDTTASVPWFSPDGSGGTANRVVVTIGIDRYAEWPHLGNAVNDARGTSEVFRKLGFTEARALIDAAATGDAIRRLTDELGSLGVNDSLIVFFAGHGGTKTQVLQDGKTVKTGYIIPVDAENQHGQVATWIRLDTWLDDIARLPANHILVILDACHSGIALDGLITRDATTGETGPVDELSRRRSRRVIVSALDDQLALDGGPIPGHSLFTGCLLQALQGGLRRDGRQTITGTELGLDLRQQVKQYPNSRQTPAFAAFGLDDHGELMIPLSPVSIDACVPRPVVAEHDVNAALRQRFAATLAKCVADRRVIAQLVTAHAPMIAITDLPTGNAATIWMYVLVELANRRASAAMSAVVHAVHLRSRRARRLDWSAYSALLRAPAVSTLASWSQLALELRRDKATPGSTDSALITDGDTLLEAVTTFRWLGPRPRDPLLEVTSKQLFGRAKPLLHEATLLPSHGPGTASWLAKISVSHARIRTRIVTVRCVGTNLVQRRYLVPRAGSICAAIVWAAFTVFALYWLSPISPISVTASLTALGVLSGLWNWIGVHLIRVLHSKHSFRSLFLAWELAALSAALVTLAVIIVPPHFIVTVTNATLNEVQLQDTTIPAGSPAKVWLSTVNDWKPAPPLCRCDRTPECEGCGRSLIVNGSGHPLFGCLAGDCFHVITKHVHDDSVATILHPPMATGSALKPITFATGAATARMLLTAHDAPRTTVFVTDVNQAKARDMSLAILPDVPFYSPDAPFYSIEFLNKGTLQNCYARATRILRFAIDRPQTHAGKQPASHGSEQPPIDHIPVTIGKTRSTWAGVPGELRACADDTEGGAPELTFRFPDENGTVTCSGDVVRQLVSFELSPPSTSHRVKIGDVESSWSSTTPAGIARACLGKPGRVELTQPAVGSRVTLPKELSITQVDVDARSEHVSPHSRVSVRCAPGDTLRAVALVGIDSRTTIKIKKLGGPPALVEPLDTTVGVTCDRNARDQACSLTDTKLVCNQPPARPEHDCLLRGKRIDIGERNDSCNEPANLADDRELQRSARNLNCRKVYECGK